MLICRLTLYWIRVALLAEGVDRNLYQLTANVTDRVALLAEGVDRNLVAVIIGVGSFASPSSRRAWIEISHNQREVSIEQVALLAEGVDRNCSYWFA